MTNKWFAAAFLPPVRDPFGYEMGRQPTVWELAPTEAEARATASNYIERGAKQAHIGVITDTLSLEARWDSGAGTSG